MSAPTRDRADTAPRPTAGEATPTTRPPRRRLTASRRGAFPGSAFTPPWIIGFCVFTLGAMIYSLVIPFSHYTLASNRIRPAGLSNYAGLIEDPKVVTS